MTAAGVTPPTLQDVARLAGVSAKTVARALNDEDHVRPQTRERVLRAADALRFRPNRLARDLRRGEGMACAGLVVGGLDNPFYSQVGAGVERAVREDDLGLVIASTDDDPARERGVVQAMLERQVRVLLVVPTAEDHTYLDGERQAGTPVVFLDRPPVALVADCVLWDNRSGVVQAVHGLVAAGHRSIAALADDLTLFTARERLGAFREAVDACGLDPRRCPALGDVHEVGAAAATAKRLLSGPEPPTALVTLNNRISVGALSALLCVGSQAALVGFDEFDLAEPLGITVVSNDPRDMGYAAARLALTRLHCPSGPPERVLLPTRLVRRGSGERPPP